MIFLFFLDAVICLNKKYPITRETCSVNINGSFYNLSNFENRNADFFYDEFLGLTIFTRMCGGLFDLDIPIYYNHQNLFSHLACNLSSKMCFPLISKYSQDYRPLNDLDFNDGLIIEYKGEPIKIYEKYFIFNIFYSIKCDYDQTSSNISLTPNIDVLDQIIRIKYELSYSGACPISTPAPSPTPKYYPNCKHTAHLPNDQTQGIQIDLNDFNSGPGGSMLSVSINNSQHYVFYQPCERILCPTNAKCNSEFSSIWFCDENVSKCVDYGISDDLQKIDTDPTNFSEPIVIQTNEGVNNRKSFIFASCDNSFFINHLEYDHSKINDRLFQLFVNTPSACVNEIPIPVPENPFHCFFEVNDSDVNISFNASTLDVKDGRVVDVKTAGLISPIERKLYFQPCSGLFCPSDADCDNFEDAYIWLCKEIMSDQDNQQCYAYGLFEKNISMSALQNGVKIEYLGSDGLSAEVDFICDYSLNEGELVMPTIVKTTNSGQFLHMEVKSRDSCPVGTPRPSPEPFYPSRPKKGETPTPMPNPNPNPMLSLFNETHYIAFNLSLMNQNVRDSHIILTSQGQKRDIDVFISPFDQSSCPPGYECDEFDLSTIWSCWINKNDEPICFPIGDSPEGITSQSIDGNNLDRGLIITYNGHYGIIAELRVNCDPYQTQIDYFPLDSNAAYQVWVNTVYGLNTSSNLACPSLFAEPFIPLATPSPTPDPNAEEFYISNYFSSSFIVGNQQTDLNLSFVNEMKIDGVVGDFIDKLEDMTSNEFTRKYEHSSFLLSPSRRKSCIYGFDCKDYESSNIWKCNYGNNNSIISNEKNSRTNLKEKMCYPIGDIRYGLNVELFDQNNIMKGIKATYYGGLGGSTSHLIFLCDHSLDSTIFNVDNVVKMLNNSDLYFYIRTGHVCPHQIIIAKNNFTWGGLFLMVFFTIFVLYFSFGVGLFFIINGDISLPHERFWVEFAESIKTASLYIFWCGKIKNLEGSYDVI
ncbi:hypothetical protein TRFO_35366 [Tritrichomonas foetus]|uniref:MRH domain-containing protein n=1 Tax=Tritrichomonas foetus TaxID=1144522 RepID=A0A1J4JLW8_9EUKA|nr:hypothetical protein TRFO_35366 [Tritrichomonas foetus]|eukprot:OHS98268.1 hypothetical protein TRFO_35366 [Tritrichomonas foetus]